MTSNSVTQLKEPYRDLPDPPNHRAGAPEQAELLGVELGDLVRRLFCLLIAPASSKPDRLLSAQEVAELLNTNTQVVYRLARNQDLPAINLGERMLRFTEFSVSEFISRRGVSRAA